MVSMLTLTRGESGDNAIGPELFDGLGLIRTEELAIANRYYGVDDQYFTRVVDYVAISVDERVAGGRTIFHGAGVGARVAGRFHVEHGRIHPGGTLAGHIRRRANAVARSIDHGIGGSAVKRFIVDHAPGLHDEPEQDAELLLGHAALRSRRVTYRLTVPGR